MFLSNDIVLLKNCDDISDWMCIAYIDSIVLLKYSSDLSLPLENH